MQDIYARILAINPDYVASEIAPEDAAAALQKRGETRTCGTMATGDHEHVIKAASDLKKLGQQCGAPAKACRRMTCQDTTASYICSVCLFFLRCPFTTYRRRRLDSADFAPQEKTAAVSIPCKDAGRMVNDILLNCCNGYRAGKSGHIYMNRDYSIWVGYGNCNHATNVFPHTYPYPGGRMNDDCYTS
jgi:hypothetical protein